MNSQKFSVVNAWIDNVAYSHSKSERTETLYRATLQDFYDFIGSTPEKTLEEYEGLTDREFRRKYARYLRAYISELTRKKYCVNTVRAKVTAVRSFFKYNDLPLGYIPIAKNKVVFHNRDITKEEIARILNKASVKDRAFFLTMAQSGLRPSTLTQLTYKQIKDDFENGSVPCCIKVPEEMTKGEYGEHFTFIAEDAVKALKAFFAQRHTPKNNERLFPFTIAAVSMRFGYAVNKLNLIKPENIRKRGRGKPQVLHLYCLRKYFRKMAGAAGQDYVNFWMGHTLGVDEHYFSRDIEHHREVYAEKAMPNLRIFEPSALETEQTIRRLEQKIEDLEQKNLELKQRLNGHTPALQQLRTELEELRNMIRELAEKQS